MKNKIWFPYLLGLVQMAVLVISVVLIVSRYISSVFVSSSVKYHLIIEIGLSLLLLYGVHHIIKTIKASSLMRKEAGKKREIKSKRIELLMLFLMISLIFHSLYFTVPMSKYHPSFYEQIIYYIMAFLQFIMLVTLVSSHEGVSEDFAKSKQKYAGVGALSGLILFYAYFALLN